MVIVGVGAAYVKSIDGDRLGHAGILVGEVGARVANLHVIAVDRYRVDIDGGCGRPVIGLGVDAGAAEEHIGLGDVGRGRRRIGGKRIVAVVRAAER